MTAKKKTVTSKATKKQNVTTIGKKEFLKKVSDKAYELSGTGATQKNLQYVFDAMCAVIEDEVRLGHTVRFIGFGTFKKHHAEARKGHNPQNGETIDIPAIDRLVFDSKVRY